MLREKLQTPAAKAGQVVIAKAIDIIPGAPDAIELSQDDVDALQEYAEEAVALEPTDEEAIASGVVLLMEIAKKSGSEKFIAFASKVQQQWMIISDADLSTAEKIWKSIGLIFQSKKRAVRKAA